MNTQWQDFLSSQHARIVDGVAHDFGDAAAERAAAENGDIVCDLAQFGLLRVSGEDAQGFLQNLLSNDIRETDVGRAQLSSFNNAKGRMLASLLVWRAGTDYLLQLPRGLCATLHKKLTMYVLRSKVKIADVSDQQVLLGVAGDAALALLHARYGALPQADLALVQVDGVTLLRRDARRVQVLLDTEQARALWPALVAQARAAGSPCWDWLDIRAGIPFVLPQTQEAFVPQMLNFELIGGINFKKGCYPGQEVVTRTHFLGKVKRRMVVAHVDSETLPSPGEEVFCGTEATGTIARTAPSPEGGYDLLAVILMDNQSGEIRLKTGELLTMMPMPYALP